MWSHVSQQHFRGEPLGYLIHYYPVRLERDLGFVTVNYTANYAELTNLTAFTEYVVNVSAVSSGGVGPGNWTTARTDDLGKIAEVSILTTLLPWDWTTTKNDYIYIF